MVAGDTREVDLKAFLVAAHDGLEFRMECATAGVMAWAVVFGYTMDEITSLAVETWIHEPGPDNLDEVKARELCVNKGWTHALIISDCGSEERWAIDDIQGKTALEGVGEGLAGSGEGKEGIKKSWCGCGCGKPDCQDPGW